MADCWVDRGCGLSGSTTSQTPQAVSISWGFSEIRNQEIQWLPTWLFQISTHAHTHTHTPKKNTPGKMNHHEPSWTPFIKSKSDGQLLDLSGLAILEFQTSRWSLPPRCGSIPGAMGEVGCPNSWVHTKIKNWCLFHVDFRVKSEAAGLSFLDMFSSYMDVSLNGGTPKTPQNDHFY